MGCFCGLYKADYVGMRHLAKNIDLSPHAFLLVPIIQLAFIVDFYGNLLSLLIGSRPDDRICTIAKKIAYFELLDLLLCL